MIPRAAKGEEDSVEWEGPSSPSAAARVRLLLAMDDPAFSLQIN